MSVLGGKIQTLRRVESRQIIGAVASVRGLSLLADDLPLPVGALVQVRRRGGAEAGESPVRGEVIGFDGPRSVVMLFDANDGIAPGMRIEGEQTAQTVQVGRSLLGRIVDGLGRPLDGEGPLTDTVAMPLNPAPTRALDRKRIDEPLPTGVRAVDAMATIGKGQRMGVFSGPGIGKSTLLAIVARNTSADVNVIALVGERGKEVRDFLETALGEEGLVRSVLVVATSDESPLLRVRAASVACAVAEYFRELGADVMLMMDSITRLAQAQRQIGLTVGEQPATKGYTPSVFAMMPRLLERAGALEQGGSITGLYAVLVEGDDLTEPISDAARGILDGHAALSRRLAARGHYPAVDVLESVSRVADDVCDRPHIAARRTVLRLIAAHAEAEELINIGAYARGSNPDCDVAIEMKEAIDAFLQQETDEKAEYAQTCRGLIELSMEAEKRYAEHATARRNAGRA
ncbi:MAG: FliI/YscN family ATPase [Planctomycetota bacterium]|nr:FliI/YscN family ATPase [Planctomycetota bacterium]